MVRLVRANQQIYWGDLPISCTMSCVDINVDDDTFTVALYETKTRLPDWLIEGDVASFQVLNHFRARAKLVKVASDGLEVMLDYKIINTYNLRE